MIAQTKPLHEITQDAVNILYREIGIVNTVRFLTQFTAGYGNYVTEKAQLFENLSLDELVAQIKKTRNRDTEN